MKMTKTTLASGAALALVLAAAPAFAGGLDQPIVQPAPAPVFTPAPVAQIGAWTGFYAGGQLGYGSVSGEYGDDEDDLFTDDIDGLIGGLHAGYMQQFGSFVLGGEIDHDWFNEFDGTTVAGTGLAGDDLFDNNLEDAPVSVDAVTRLKLKAGYDAGLFLPYLTAGVARAHTTGLPEDNYDGGFLGLGVDYRVTDSIRVGGELLQHRFNDVEIDDLNLDATTATARVSFQF